MYAVHIGLLDVFETRKCSCNLHCRNIFTLPSERISDPIHKIVEIVGVALQYVTSSEPSVTKKDES